MCASTPNPGHVAPSAKTSPLSAFLECYRKPISRITAIFFVALLVVSAPPSFCQFFGLSASWRSVVLPAIGLLLVTVGVLGRLWCALYIAGHKDTNLRVDGPYSVSRNMLYFFSFVGLMGVMLYLEQTFLMLFVAPLFLIYYHFVIRSEELRLRELFGKAYEAYCGKTPRFWPRFSKYYTRETLTIEPARILKAAKDVIWFFLALVLFGVVKAMQNQGFMPVMIIWPF